MTLYRAALAALLVSLAAVVVSILAGSCGVLAVALVAAGVLSYAAWTAGDAPCITVRRIARYRVSWRAECRQCDHRTDSTTLRGVWRSADAHHLAAHQVTAGGWH